MKTSLSFPLTKRPLRGPKERTVMMEAELPSTYLQKKQEHEVPKKSLPTPVVEWFDQQNCIKLSSFMMFLLPVFPKLLKNYIVLQAKWKKRRKSLSSHLLPSSSHFPHLSALIKLEGG